MRSLLLAALPLAALPLALALPSAAQAPQAPKGASTAPEGAPSTPPGAPGAAEGAQAGSPLPALHARLQTGFAALQGGWGEDPIAEGARVERAAAVLDEVRAALGKAAAPPAARAVFDENLTALARELERSRLALACAKAQAAILEKHRAGAPALEADLAALSRAASELSAKGGPGWQATATHFVERAARFAQDREQVLALERAKQSEADERTRALALEEALRAANRARRKLEGQLEASAAPLPEPLLEAYLKAAQDVARLSEPAGRFYTMSYRDFLVANAWRDGALEAAAGRLANLYQGALVDAGLARGKVLKVSIPAQPGWCYAAVLRFARDTGAEDVTDLDVSTKGGAPLARFQVPWVGVGWQGVHGACSEDGGRITLAAKIRREGKNDLRYVVVGWPREDFPLYVATYMDAVAPDLCDTEAWSALWTRPVPGALVYRAGEPFLVARAERPPTGTVTLLSVGGDRIVGVPKGELSSAAPKERRFQTKREWKGCPVADAAHAPESTKLARCHADIDRRYEKPLARASRRLEAASGDSAKARAQAELDRVLEKEAADRQKKCEPIERRIREQWQRAVDRILDHYTENPVASPLDRAGQLIAEQEAKPDLR